MKELHVLLVEDNEGDIVLTQEAFEASKIRAKMSVVRNGQEALNFLMKTDEYVNAEKPDLILLDLNIPIYNGIEVLRQVKQHPELKKIPVIILTTSSNPIEIREAYENYTNSFVTKPIEMDEFIRTVLAIEEFWLQICKLSD